MKSTISRYIKANIKYPLLIEDIPAEDLDMIIVIPCHNESRIVETVRSIYTEQTPKYSIEITVVIYACRDDNDTIHDQNKESDKALHALNDLPDWCRLYVIMNNNFSGEKANMDFAAKIGMDDAVRRFSHMENENGLIVRHSADVAFEKDYFTTIAKQSSASNLDCLDVIQYCESGK